MYFSKNNEDITYINHYSGLLEVNGEGCLCREDAEVWPETKRKNWAKEYDTLSITEGITGIREGYLEAFSHISCLILSRSVAFAEVSEELKQKYRINDVLIRGEYDTFAERFAQETGLKFLHSDIHLADDEIAEHYEFDVITLRFHTDGSSDIHFDCYMPGSSAGSYGGGEVVNELPEDFYVGCGIEDFAERFSERVRPKIMANETLRRFLEAANRRHRKP